MFLKIGVLKISQISQVTPLLEILFNNIAGPKACNFIANRLQDSWFPMKFGNFKEHLFYRTPLVSASEINEQQQLFEGFANNSY